MAGAATLVVAIVGGFYVVSAAWLNGASATACASTGADGPACRLAEQATHLSACGAGIGVALLVASAFTADLRRLLGDARRATRTTKWLLALLMVGLVLLVAGALRLAMSSSLCLAHPAALSCRDAHVETWAGLVACAAAAIGFLTSWLRRRNPR